MICSLTVLQRMLKPRMVTFLDRRGARPPRPPTRRGSVYFATTQCRVRPIGSLNKSGCAFRGLRPEVEGPELALGCQCAHQSWQRASSCGSSLRRMCTRMRLGRRDWGVAVLRAGWPERAPRGLEFKGHPTSSRCVRHCLRGTMAWQAAAASRSTDSSHAAGRWGLTTDRGLCPIRA